MSKLILILINFLLFTSAAMADQDFVRRLGKLEQTSLMFHKICFDKNGKFYADKVYVLKDRQIDCSGDLNLLQKSYAKLEKRLTKLENDCRPEMDENLNNISNITEVLKGKKVCPAKVEPEMSCASDLLCNAFSSVLAVPLTGADALLKVADSYYRPRGKDIYKSPVVADLKKCSRPGNSCLTNLFKGIWDSLFTSVKGMWTLVSGAAKLGANAVKGAYNYTVDSIGKLFSNVEDKTTEKMMAAQKLPNSSLQKFKEDPLLFVKNMVKSLYNSVIKGIKTNYGCEKWSGAPHLSKCVSPMSNWECGTCNQKLNVICGVVGFGAGEIVTAFFTGGAVAVGKTVAMTSVKLGSKGVSKLSPMMNKFPKVTYQKSSTQLAKEAAIQAAKATYAKSLIAWQKFNAIKPVVDIKKASGKVASNIRSTGIVIGQNKSVQVISKASEYAAKPFTSYLGLMNQAFGRGYGKVDDTLLRMTHKTTGAQAGKSEVVGATSSRTTEPSRPVIPKVTSNERNLRLETGKPDKEALDEIIAMTKDKLDDPVKFHYVMDRLEELKSVTSEKRAGIILDISNSVKSWSAKSPQVQLAQIRYEKLLQETQKQLNKIKNKRPQISADDAAHEAQLLAYQQRSRALELKHACTAKTSGSPISGKAAALYTNANLSMSVGMVGVTYAAANWEKEKNADWAKRLGYEVFMAYLISKWGSKIATNQASTFGGKVASGYLLNFKISMIESTAYNAFFSNDKEAAKKRIEEIASSPHFEEDIKKLEEYVANRSRIEDFIDASTDAYREVASALMGKKVEDITEADLKNIKQDAFKDPATMDRLMDVVSDQMYSEKMKGNTYGSQFVDRVAFESQWAIHSVPRGVIMGMLTYQAVCRNIDNPMKALMAFGAIQGTNKAASGLIYYEMKSDQINQ